MMRLYTQSGETGDRPGSPDAEDPGLAGLLRGIAAGETPVIAVHAGKQARSGFLGRLLPALRQDGVRPAPVSSRDGEEITLATLMDQVVGSACSDQIDRLERCHAALTTLAPAEKRIALVIDDAHLLTDQCLRYLDLVASVTRPSAPLLIVLVGSPAIWDRLPLTGRLAAANVARRLALDDATLWAQPEAPADPGRSLQIVDTVRAVRTLPVLIPPERPKRAWFAMAACAGSFAAVGGFAAGLYWEEVLTSHALWPRVTATQPSIAARAAPASAAQPIGGPAPVIAAHNLTAHDAALSRIAPATVKANQPVSDLVQLANWGPAARTDQTAALPLVASVVPVTATVVTPPSAHEVVSAVLEAAPPPTPIIPVPIAVSVPVPMAPPPVTRVATAIPVPSVDPATPTLSAVASASIVPASLAPPPISPGMVAMLIARGDALLATGDITAARLMYHRAADTQSMAGALAMGMTFDPKLLAQIGVQGLSADTQRAAIWYQRAVALGSSDAVELLRQLRNEAK